MAVSTSLLALTLKESYDVDLPMTDDTGLNLSLDDGKKKDAVRNNTDMANSQKHIVSYYLAPGLPNNGILVHVYLFIH